jgi:hypothetical protein
MLALLSTAAGRLWERKSDRRQTEAAPVTLATARAARSVVTSRPQPSQMEVKSCLPRPRYRLSTLCGPRVPGTVAFGCWGADHRQLSSRSSSDPHIHPSFLSLRRGAAMLDIDACKTLESILPNIPRKHPDKLKGSIPVASVRVGVVEQKVASLSPCV